MVYQKKWRVHCKQMLRATLATNGFIDYDLTLRNGQVVDKLGYYQAISIWLDYRFYRR